MSVWNRRLSCSATWRLFPQHPRPFSACFTTSLCLIDRHYFLVIFHVAVPNRIIKYINGRAGPRIIDTGWHLGWRRVLNWSRHGNTILLIYSKCRLFQYTDAICWATRLCRMQHTLCYMPYIIRLHDKAHVYGRIYTITNIAPLSYILTVTYAYYGPKVHTSYIYVIIRLRVYRIYTTGPALLMCHVWLLLTPWPKTNNTIVLKTSARV